MQNMAKLKQNNLLVKTVTKIYKTRERIQKLQGKKIVKNYVFRDEDDIFSKPKSDYKLKPLVLRQGRHTRSAIRNQIRSQYANWS